MFQELPLLNFLSSKFKDVNLSNVAVVSCQHLLQSNYITLEYLFRLGLKPQNTFLIGKAYSSNREVAEQLISRGVHVCDDSFSFNSHESFDAQFERYTHTFAVEVATILQKDPSIQKVILVDDGGQLVTHFNTVELQKSVRAVEWTSSGYRKLLSLDLHFPVLNMARSESKLKIESPVIGHGVVEKIQKYYPHLFLSEQRAVVIGAGPIGQAVKISLEEVGKKAILIDLDTPLEAVAEPFDVIVGCTGESVLGEVDLDRLDNVVLVSASSSDREFQAVSIRRRLPQNNAPHQEYALGTIRLANAGFPINFDGEVQFLPLKKIQITLGLVFASVCLCASQSFAPGLQHFPEDLDTAISDFFLSLSR